MRVVKAICVVVALLLVATSAERAYADGDKEEARQIFRSANDQYHAGKLAQALKLYRKAYELFPSEKILLNQAACLADMGRNAAAAQLYLQYLRESDDSQKRVAVRAELHKLGKTLGRLKIPEQKKGTRVYVRGDKHPNTPPTILWLKPGKHDVVLKNKDEEVTYRVTMRAGVVEQLTPAAKTENDEEDEEDEEDEQEEEEEEDSSPSVEVTSRRGSGMSRLRLASWITGATGLVALGVGVKYGFDVRSIESELSGTSTAWTPELQARHEKGQTAEKRMYLFTGIGAAVVATSAVLYVLSDSDKPKPTIQASSESWSVGLAGTF